MPSTTLGPWVGKEKTALHAAVCQETVEVFVKPWEQAAGKIASHRLASNIGRSMAICKASRIWNGLRSLSNMDQLAPQPI